MNFITELRMDENCSASRSTLNVTIPSAHGKVGQQSSTGPSGQKGTASGSQHPPSHNERE